MMKGGHQIARVGELLQSAVLVPRCVTPELSVYLYREADFLLIELTRTNLGCVRKQV